MRSAIAILTLITSLGTGVALIAGEPGQKTGDGWRSLFDGKTLTGWQITGDAAWRVEDGMIATDGDKPGWLMTEGEYSDFELYLEFQAPAETNSGIFLRTPLVPTDPAKDCYELNIAPADNPFPTGCFVARQRSTLIPFKYARPGTSHTLNIVAIGGKFTVELDGQLILEYEDPTPIARGHIGLQAKEGRAAFSQLCIRPIEAR